MENFQEICCSVKLRAVVRPQSHKFCFAHEVLDGHDCVIKVLGRLRVETSQADCIIFQSQCDPVIINAEFFLVS